MNFQDLPTVLPLYASDGVILLPRAQLPLLFDGGEEKALIDYAIRKKHRLIGVVQPNPEGGNFQKGCVGRIISFQEGVRFFVTLGGLCRFKIEEVIDDGLIKKARVSYQDYESDLKDSNPDPFVDRPRLLHLLKEYLDDQDITANWDEIDHASDDLIISSLSMACPFDPIEKQALLETATLSQRCDIMIALMEMSSPQFKGRGPMMH